MTHVPHLHKSIRNNFQNTDNIVFNGMKAKWERLLEMEPQNINFLYMNKICPAHVNPKYRAKMRVKLAPQLLSNTIGAILTLMALAERSKGSGDTKYSKNSQGVGLVV